MSVRSCHPVQSAKEHWTGSIFGSFLTACFEKGKSLSSVPIHHICSLPLPKGVIAAINRVDPFSWIGEDSCSGAKCLIVWEKASQPKCEGGLGIKGIALQNKCLLFKFAHKFFQREKSPWADGSTPTAPHRSTW